MATALTRTIYGANKALTLDKFNVGSLTKAVTFDLTEFGAKGVQGLVVKGTDANTLVQKYLAKPGAANLYCVAGTSGGHLVFLLRDKTKASFEAGPVTLVKGYDKLRETLAANTGAVSDVSEAGHGDEDIDDAAFSHAERVGAGDVTEDSPERPMDLGGITGDVVLCAHGEPRTKPGRVIGSALGNRTPEQIVQILTGNNDPAQRLAPGYTGKITLAGCFTASGGPEADKQDDPFAMKVLGLLRARKGYEKVSVVGMPGPTWTADGRADTMQEGYKGPVPKVGVEVVKPDLESTRNGIDAIRLKIDQLSNGLMAAAERAPENEQLAFFSTPGATAVLDKIKALEADITRISASIDDKSRLQIAGLKGTFGLRQLNTKTKGKFAKFFGR